MNSNIANIKAGELIHFVDIIAFTRPQNDYGDSPTETAEIYAQVWASITQKSGSTIDMSRINTTGAKASYEIKMRWFPGVTVNHVVRWNGKLYAINAIDDVENRHIKYVIDATEYLRV